MMAPSRSIIDGMLILERSPGLSCGKTWWMPRQSPHLERPCLMAIYVIKPAEQSRESTWHPCQNDVDDSVMVKVVVVRDWGP